MIITDKQTIIDFLEGKGKDYKDRTFEEIITYSDKVMEECHDQVQWMFPLHEESKFAQTYPILTKETVEAAKNNTAIKQNLCKAQDRMQKFYGIHQDRWDRDIQREWCKEFNHNLLRITRIVRCLRFFGLEDEAKEFYDKILYVGQHFDISNVTKAYWWRAMNEDVWTTLK